MTRRLTMDIYLKHLKNRYKEATRKGKDIILNEFCENTGFHRKHAIRLLTQHTKLAMSEATIDRILQPERNRYPKRLCGTKPGSLLKKHIPVKTATFFRNSFSIARRSTSRLKRAISAA